MSLLVFAIIVLIVAGLAVWAVGLLPLGYPASVIAQVAIIIVAIIVICNHAGFM